MLIAIVVVLAGIVAVAVGRGGELSHEEVDHAPLDMGPMSATDVVLLRPPTALWGYSVQITDQALERIAGAIRDRDVRIVALEQRIAELTGYDDYKSASPARHARRNQQLSEAGFYTASEMPVPASDPPPALASEPDPGLASEPDPALASESGDEPESGHEPESGDEPDTGTGPAAPEPESGHEPDTGTGPAAPERAAAVDQPAVIDQPAAKEIAHDQAVNRTNG